MSEILGHDVDGRPLRAGDRVESIVTSCASSEAAATVGKTGRVVDRFWGAIRTDILCSRGGRLCSITGRGLRRIDDRPELGSWDEIEKITGWNPTKQPVEA